MNLEHIEFKSSSFSALTIKIKSAYGLDNFDLLLQEKLKTAPNFFKNANVALDLDLIGFDLDFNWIKKRLKLLEMNLVGVVANDNLLSRDFLKQQDLLLLNAKSNANQDLEKISNIKPKIVNGLVRSGQQVYGKNRCVIVIGNVNTGAEIIADGSIHIYGSLKGKALAGASGDESAFIFCNQLDAELISIAGIHAFFDDIKAKKIQGQARISCYNENLKFNEL